jgi:hypothetical protein
MRCDPNSVFAGARTAIAFKIYQSPLSALKVMNQKLFKAVAQAQLVSLKNRKCEVIHIFSGAYSTNVSTATPLQGCRDNARA